jgi:hypothetical protein
MWIKNWSNDAKVGHKALFNLVELIYIYNLKAYLSEMNWMKTNLIIFFLRLFILDIRSLKWSLLVFLLACENFDNLQKYNMKTIFF